MWKNFFNFEIITKYRNRIKFIYTYGESALYIEKKLKKTFDIKTFKSLGLVINQVFKDLNKINVKSNILFAPACSSYDQFKNFEERGIKFDQLIKQKLKHKWNILRIGGYQSTG